MTIEVRRAVPWITATLLLGIAAFAGYGCAGASKVRHGDSIDVSQYPKDIQDAYQVFAVPAAAATPWRVR